MSFFGFANTPGDRKRIFLSKNGDVFIGKEGDFINRRYKIVHITSNSVEIEDLINDVRQKILLNE